MAPHDVPVFSNLGQRRLVRPHRNSMAVFPLFTSFLHAEEQVCIVILGMNRVPSYLDGSCRYCSPPGS